MRWREFLIEPLTASFEEQAIRRSDSSPPGADTEVIAVLVSSAVLLTFHYYWFTHRGPPDWLLSAIGIPRVTVENREIVRLGYRFVGDTLVYVIGPLVVLGIVGGRPLSDYGLKLRGALTPWPLYVAMYSIMLPFIYLAALTPSFQKTYPFYSLLPGESVWPRLLIWEVLYALQFVGLEFFFRGFMLHGTRLRFGPYAILVMTIPYCMIHFGKPLPETLGAIGAGVVLGFMSLRYRSIWLGAALHVAVAWTMDALAVMRA